VAVLQISTEELIGVLHCEHMYVRVCLDSQNCGQDCTKTRRALQICGLACCGFTRKNFRSMSV